MFSMAGIPPLAGFFGKWYVFLAAVEAGLVSLAVIGVVMSVVGAFYYLRIIRLMYFDDTDTPLDEGIPMANRVVLGASVAVILLFFAGLGSLLVPQYSSCALITALIGDCHDIIAVGLDLTCVDVAIFSDLVGGSGDARCPAQPSLASRQCRGRRKAGWFARGGISVCPASSLCIAHTFWGLSVAALSSASHCRPSGQYKCAAEMAE